MSSSPPSAAAGLALPVNKLAASGWGTPKNPRTATQNTMSAPNTSRSSDPLDKTPKGNLEDKINLEVMLKLRDTFQKADTDGGGDLDIDEFVDAFDGVLPAGSQEELRKLFLRIDANSDGTVDWDEFATFILLENQGAANLRESETVLQFHPTQMPDKVPLELAHRSPMMQIVHLPPDSGVGERYATAGRDGTVRLWSVKDLSHHKTLCNGTAWVTSLVFTPNTGKLAVSSFARTIKLYDLVNGEMVGSATELDHAVYTMDCAVLDKAAHELMIVGDIGGCVQALQLKEHNDPDQNFIDSEVKREDQFRFNRHWKQELHTDWVSHVRYVPDLAGVVTSSLDKTLAIVDIERRVETRRMTGHTKGVHGFEWSALYKFVASAGMDRKVMLWNPFSCKHIAVLQGHAASVRSVAINERDNQIISMSIDKTIKVWDIRNHKCLQTFSDNDTYRPENIISAMVYDSSKRWLVTGNLKLKAWPLRSVINKTSGAHAASVSCVLYSPNFAEAITADHDGTVCVWIISTGKLRFRFTKAHGSHRITAMSLDANNRRLITGADNGELKMWNFSSGACIKTMTPKGIGMEVTGITCTQGMYFNNHILSVGWDRRVTFYDDEDAKHLSPIRYIGHNAHGHDGDILSVSIMDGSGTLATSGYEGHILIWNVDSGAVKQRLVPPGLSEAPGVDGGPPDGVAVEKVQFMFDKLHHILLSVGADRMLRLWDALEGRLVLEVYTAHRLGESIVSLACRQDNKYIATGDSSGWMKIWNASRLNGERIQDASGAIREYACWLAHAGSVADIAWVGADEPFLLSSSSDMTVTLWQKDGARIGDFGKDEWRLRDETTWITRGSEEMIADPNAGTKDKGNSDEQIKSILRVPSSHTARPGQKPPREAALPVSSDRAVGPGCLQLHEEPSFDEEPPEDTEGVPTALLLDPITQHVHKGRYKAHPVGTDPRMDKIFMPSDSKMINHPGTQGRDDTSIHHLLHVSELKEIQRYDNNHTNKTDSMSEMVRPSTVPSVGLQVPSPVGHRRMKSARLPRHETQDASFATRFGNFAKFDAHFAHKRDMGGQMNNHHGKS